MEGNRFLALACGTEAYEKASLPIGPARDAGSPDRLCTALFTFEYKRLSGSVLKAHTQVRCLLYYFCDPLPR